MTDDTMPTGQLQAMSEAADDPFAKMTKSSRDPDELRGRFESWLTTRLGPEAEPRIESFTVPEANGMSSETMLLDVSWVEDGERRTHELVVRMEPAASDVPVFPSYDLALQFDVMRLVAEHTEVPVPVTLWLETDPDAVGAEFFVMERAHGRVPPDVMPYNLGSWLRDASPEERRRLQDAAVRVVAGVHGVDLDAVDAGFLDLDVPGETPLRRHVENQRRYYDWLRGDQRYPVIEATFDWLEEHWPADEGDTVVSWGDARIGNMMFDGFEPVAVLDWEMAALAPRGVDVGWMVFLHSFFEFIGSQLGMEGMPEFMQAADVRATYQEASGVDVGDLAWYEVYAALRHAIVMARITARSVHFGEAEMPEDLDEAIMHHPVLREMLAGTYWD